MIYFQTDNGTLYHGDCLEVMSSLPDNSVDAVVTDPPYGLTFMGKNWDNGVPGEEFLANALRVCKPGAHLLAFGGSRTYHRLAVAIEDAGWEIRDCIMWIYGAGFPIIMARKPISERNIAMNMLKCGSAARFFYCAKASPGERNAGLDGFEKKETAFNSNGFGDGQPAKMRNHHPTVKPISLMAYLIKLIAPKWIGIEKEAEYCEIAKARIEHAAARHKQMELAN